MLPCNVESRVVPAGIFGQFFESFQHQLRMVVHLTQVSQKDLLQLLVVQVFHEVFAFPVGYVAMGAANPLFQVGEVRAIHEKFEVVIGLDDQCVTGFEAIAHQVRDDPQVGADSKTSLLMLDDKSRRVPGIVRNGKGMNVKVSDDEFASRLKNVGLGQEARLRWKALQGSLGTKDRQVETPAERSYPSSVVRVFMAKDHSIEMSGVSWRLIHAFHQFL